MGCSNANRHQPETEMTTINYSANGAKFSFEIENIEDHSPRSIYIACLNNYKSTGANVSMPRYDDDNDAYSPSNTEITIEVTKELFELPVLSGMSKTEIRKMFN